MRIMKPYIINIWTLFFLLNIVLPISLDAQSGSEAIPYGNNKNAGYFIEVNGIKPYYEIYGNGAPLILIHGKGGNIAYMKPQIEYFSESYNVIVMDCRGRAKVAES